MMKKTTFMAMAVALVLTTGCGMSGVYSGASSDGSTVNSGSTGNVLGSVLGSVLGGSGSASTIGNVLTSVIGLDKLTQKNLVGTWSYNGPGCAFTSEQLLAKAGGEVVAGQIKEKMLPTFQSLGLSASNTKITFNSDGTYTATIKGKKISGNWTFDESTRKVTLSGLLLNINCYAKRNSNGISLLFEASKLLTVLQTVSALSGNQTLSTIGEISKSYDGVRLGFDLK